MGLEQSVQEAHSEVRAMREQMQRLVDEVAALRRALPPFLVKPTIASKALGLSISTIRRRIDEGRLPVDPATGLINLGAMHPPAEPEVLRRAMELKQRESSRKE